MKTLFRFIAPALAALLTLGGPVHAQEMKFFRIGTGGVGGTYYPVGGLIAHVPRHAGPVAVNLLKDLIKLFRKALTAPIAPALDQLRLFTGKLVAPILKEAGRNDGGIVGPVFK